MSTNPQFTTVAEELFAKYLDAHGFAWEFEREFPGKRKHPDFTVTWRNEQLLFEVKQREGRPFGPETDSLEPHAEHVDPYAGMRSVIDKAGRQFREFEERCCSLVVFNAGDARTWFWPKFVFGAMLGDLGFVNPESTTASSQAAAAVQDVFMRGRGKMRHGECGTIQNTRISSIMVLEDHIDSRAFDQQCERVVAWEESQSGRNLHGQERAVIAVEAHILRLEMQLDSELPRHVSRVVVCENPHAQRQLPRDMFRGPYDERYAIENRSLTCIYKGNEL